MIVSPARQVDFKEGMFPVAESISARTLSLPLSAALGDEDVERVIEALQECLR